MKIISINADMLDDLYGSQYDEDTAKKLCEDSLRNIQREYNLMYELRGNPNVVRCDDMKVVGHNDGIGCDVYIMMELLTPLQKVLKAGSLDEKDVLRLGTDICRALIVCEQHKIIHRDIKPPNILVTDNGTYKLGDFGTARTFEHTSSATVAGTETYMAPEVIRREKYGRDVDTYSLGLVMYRMLNKGQLPFVPLDKIPTADDRAKSLQRRIAGEKLPVPAAGSPALKAVVLTACSYDRRGRYRSAGDMLEDLLRAEEGTMPMFRPFEDDGSTVIEETQTGGKGTVITKDNGGKGRKSSGKNKTEDNEDNNSLLRKFLIMALIMLLAGGLITYISSSGNKGGDAPAADVTDETVEDETEDTADTGETAAAATSDGAYPAEGIPSSPGEESGWIQYEMWDYPDKGSGASNDDEYHSMFWTVYYDRKTGVFDRIVREEWFDMQGYSEAHVKEYVDRLEKNYSGDENSFVSINYKGGVTGEHGNLYVLEVEYRQVDVDAHRAKADEIFQAVDWGTTITSADETIRHLGGERYRAGIESEDDAVEWARYFANLNDLVPSGVTFGYMPMGESADSAGKTWYMIKGYEDRPENIATYFNWNISEYGEIIDDLNEEVNGLKYTE